jgi:hypothetical protein
MLLYICDYAILVPEIFHVKRSSGHFPYHHLRIVL